MKPTPEAERAAREIVLKARAGRKRTPRWLWILALGVSAVCVGALVISVWTTEPKPAMPHAHSGGGLNGLGLGIAIGIVIGSLLAVRKR